MYNEVCVEYAYIVNDSTHTAQPHDALGVVKLYPRSRSKSTK